RAHDFDVQGTLHYMVLEYIDGIDLQKHTDKFGPFPFDKAADCIRQAALGLQHAHDKNFVHRDMKPANLMVDGKGFCKVLDLGVARITGSDEGPSLTLAHKEDVLGTADFLAPEQALNSHQVDHRADIYALGCTLYYMLTGHVPFREPNLAKKLMAHQTQEPPPVTASRPDCPPRLLAICQKMMAKQADDRYQTMNEVADDLADFLRGKGIEAAPAAGPMSNDGSSLNVPLDSTRGADLPSFVVRPGASQPEPTPSRPAQAPPRPAAPAPVAASRPAAPPTRPAPPAAAPLARAQQPEPAPTSQDDPLDDESLYGVKETPKSGAAYTPAALGIDSDSSYDDDEASSIHTEDAEAAAAARAMLEEPYTPPASYTSPNPSSASRPAPAPAIGRTIPTGSSSSSSRAEPPRPAARPEPARPSANREPDAPLQRIRVLQNRPAPWYGSPLVLMLTVVVVLLTTVLTALIVILATGNGHLLNLPMLQPTPVATSEATSPAATSESTPAATLESLPAGPSDEMPEGPADK
ncbi:MAG TPA: serine/threonine-protein kinase, partial [Pirellulales bacterium]